MTSDEPASVPLRRNRDFNLLSISLTVSDLGSSMTVLMFPLAVLSIGGSALQAGVVSTSAAITRALFRLPGGVLSDRGHRRRTMMLSDAGRLLLLSVLALSIWAGRPPFALFVAVAVAVAILEVIFQPAAVAAVSRLVPEDQLPDAFARNEVRTYAAQLSGLPLGGLLFGVNRAAPFIADAVSYLISLIGLLAIRTPLEAGRANHRPQAMTADIRLGLRHVWHSSYLRSVLLLLIPVDFAVHGALFALVVNLRQQGHSPETIGVAQAVIAVGGLSGALCSKWMQRRVSFQTLLICATGVGFALMIAATALTGRLAVIVPLTGAIFMVPAANAAIFGRLALVTPEHLQGRVVSVFAFAAGGASAWAPLTIGLLLDWASAPAAMLACAIAVGLSVVAAFSTKVDSDPVLTAG